MGDREEVSLGQQSKGRQGWLLLWEGRGAEKLP